MQICQNMTLDDLKTGMIVTRRNGTKMIVFKNTLKSYNKCNDFITDTRGHRWDPLCFYNQDLTNNTGSKELDIVKVECPVGAYDLGKIDGGCIVLWEEHPAVKLTVAEIEARLGYKIEIVSDTNEEE